MPTAGLCAYGGDEQEEKWTPKKTHKGNKWNGPPQYEDKTGNLMMLPTDMCLIEDPGQSGWFIGTCLEPLPSSVRRGGDGPRHGINPTSVHGSSCS